MGSSERFTLRALLPPLFPAWILLLFPSPAGAKIKPAAFQDLVPAVGSAPLLDRLFSAAEITALSEKAASAPLAFSYRTSRLLGVPYSQLGPRPRLAAARYALDQSLGEDKASKSAILSAELGIPPDLATRLFEIPLSSFFDPAKFGMATRKEEEDLARRLTRYAEGLALIKQGQAAAGAEALRSILTPDIAVLNPSQVKPPDSDLYYALGLACLNLGDTAGAKIAFGAGLEVDSSHAGCRAGLARVSPQSAPDPAQAKLDRERTERQAMDARAAEPLRTVYKAEVRRHKGSRRKMALFAAAGAALLMAGIVDLAVLDKPAEGDSEERAYELGRRRTGAGALMGLGGGVILLSGGGMLYYQTKIWGTPSPESFLATDKGFVRPAGPSAAGGFRLELARHSF